MRSVAFSQSCSLIGRISRATSPRTIVNRGAKRSLGESKSGHRAFAFAVASTAAPNMEALFHNVVTGPLVFRLLLEYLPLSTTFAALLSLCHAARVMVKRSAQLRQLANEAHLLGRIIYHGIGHGPIERSVEHYLSRVGMVTFDGMCKSAVVERQLYDALVNVFWVKTQGMYGGWRRRWGMPPTRFEKAVEYGRGPTLEPPSRLSLLRLADKEFKTLDDKTVCAVCWSVPHDMPRTFFVESYDRREGWYRRNFAFTCGNCRDYNEYTEKYHHFKKSRPSDPPPGG